jgi:hypothetical protein
MSFCSSIRWGKASPPEPHPVTANGSGLALFRSNREKGRDLLLDFGALARRALDLLFLMLLDGQDR